MRLILASLCLFASFCAGLRAAEPPASLEPPDVIPLGTGSYSKEYSLFHSWRYALFKKTIEAELASGPHPDWAGAYGASARYEGQEFLISPSGRFVKNQWSDVATSFRGTYGTARLVGQQFILRLAPGLEDTWGRPFVPGPFFIAWRDRRYLVEPQDMLVFANAVSAAGSPPGRLCAVDGFKCVAMQRSELASLVDSELPALPAPWNEWLLRNEVEAKVTRHIAYTTTEYKTYKLVKTRVEIDRGADAGLKPGMLLHFGRGGMTRRGSLTVETVQPTTAIVEFSAAPDSPPPAIGASVWSRW